MAVKMNNILKIIVFSIIVVVVSTAVCVLLKEIIKEDAIDLGFTEDSVSESPLSPTIFSPSSLGWEEAVSSAPWEARDSQAVVVYKNRIWLMGGLDANGHISSNGTVNYGDAAYFSDVWSSEDGKNWQLVTEKAAWGERRSMQVVDFKGKMWLMGGWGPEVGYKNSVWSSQDGVTWQLETSSAAWPAREGGQLLVFQDNIWLIGGVNYDKRKLFTDIWYSADGINWIKATENAGWSPRWDFASAVFNNKLWTMGGMDFEGNIYKDIWSSADGVKWALVKEDPPFASRQGGGLIDYENKLWVVSRLNISEYDGGANDVWYSDDGISWRKTAEDPLWTGREDVCIAVFKNKIWVLGGMDKNWQWKNDVWFSTSNYDPTHL